MGGHSHSPTQQSVHSHELHAHKAGDANHAHAKEITSQKVLTIALFITIGFAVVEVFAGIYANSLALISDAGHMVTDAAGLLLAVIAQFISKRPPSAKYSFGLGRAEALAAFVKAIRNMEGVQSVYGDTDNQQLLGLLKHLGVDVQNSDLENYTWMAKV